MNGKPMIPSSKKRRAIFGIRKAQANASIASDPDIPITATVLMSRRSPKHRLTSMKSPIIAAPAKERVRSRGFDRVREWVCV